MKPLLSIPLVTLMLTGVISCFSDRGVAPNSSGECRVPIGSEVPGSTVIIIRNFSFEPASVTVRAGARITWVNCDQPGQPSHTSTADGGVWNAPLLAPGEAFTETFDQVGDFGYHCEPHPSMTGTVSVR